MSGCEFETYRTRSKNHTVTATHMNETFLEALRIQRWDDHRYYHHSRVNQALHLLSAISFLCAYALLFIEPAAASLVAWCISMTSRQAGHFFFEPRGYDHVNDATHEEKEDIKVGYNLRRKVVLMGLWAAAPLIIYFTPGVFGLVQPFNGLEGYLRRLGMVWLYIGVGGLIFRTIHLFFLRDVQTGLVWMTKILTDPIHDILLYWKSPFYLMKGEWIDPMRHARHR